MTSSLRFIFLNTSAFIGHVDEHDAVQSLHGSYSNLFRLSFFSIDFHHSSSQEPGQSTMMMVPVFGRCCLRVWLLALIVCFCVFVLWHVAASICAGRVL